jgi:hypothetical protein
MGYKAVRLVAQSTQQNLSFFLTVIHLKLKIKGNLSQLWLKIAQGVSLANLSTKWMMGKWGLLVMLKILFGLLRTPGCKGGLTCLG